MSEKTREELEAQSLIEEIKAKIRDAVEGSRLNEQGRRQTFQTLRPSFVHSDIPFSQFVRELAVLPSSEGGTTLTHFASAEERYGVIGSARRDEVIQTPEVYRALISVSHSPQNYDRHVMLYMPEGHPPQLIYMTGTTLYDPSIYTRSRLNPPVPQGSTTRPATLSDLRFIQKALAART